MVVTNILEFFMGLFVQYVLWLLTTLGIQKRLKQNDNTDISTSDNVEKKAQQIERCLDPSNNGCISSSSIDLWELRELALSSGGLLQPKYRQRAWPRLVGLSSEDDIPELNESHNLLEKDKIVETTSTGNGEKTDIATTDKTSHLDASLDMIRRDVGRSVVFRYACNNKHVRDDIEYTDKGLVECDANIENTDNGISPEISSERLARVLERTVQQPRVTSSTLHYYQGLHDIAGVILHNMDYQEYSTIQIMRQISHSHLRDAMRENFGNITWLLSMILPSLVEKVEPKVHSALQMSQVELANICLPWMITWYTHDMHDPDIAGRFVDAFLAGHPLMPVYFAVALMTHPVLKQEIIQQAEFEDPASMFLLIKRMPLTLRLAGKGFDDKDLDSAKIPFQEVLDDCILIMKKFPPRSLVELVDPETYSRLELLKRMSSISLFKAPASWNMSSGNLRSNKNDNYHTGRDHLSSSHFVRAKLASGVPMLMMTVSNSAVLNSPTWGSRRYLLIKKKKNILKKAIRSIMGKQKIKNS